MGTYACQATNEVGSTQKQILLAGTISDLLFLYHN